MPYDNEDCKFYQDGNLTVFETPSPYFNNMNCTQNVTCSNPSDTVQYEFEYFETDYSYYRRFDKLYVNGKVYQGYYVPTDEWLNSFSSKVDLVFTSDYTGNRKGFKMNLKCSPGPCDGGVCQMPATTTSTTTAKTTLITHDSFFDIHGYHSTTEISTTTRQTTTSITTTPSTTSKTTTTATTTTTTPKNTTRKAKSTTMSTTTTATSTTATMPTTPTNGSVITSSAVSKVSFVSCNSFLLYFFIYVFQ